MSILNLKICENKEFFLYNLTLKLVELQGLMCQGYQALTRSAITLSQSEELIRQQIQRLMIFPSVLGLVSKRLGSFPCAFGSSSSSFTFICKLVPHWNVLLLPPLQVLLISLQVLFYCFSCTNMSGNNCWPKLLSFLIPLFWSIAKVTANTNFMWVASQGSNNSKHNMLFLYWAVVRTLELELCGTIVGRMFFYMFFKEIYNNTVVPPLS